VVDDFNQQKESNAVGGGWSVYQDALGSTMSIAFADEGSEAGGSALAMQYRLTEGDSFAGLVTSLDGLDLRGYAALRLRVRADRAGQDLVIGFKDASGLERKARTSAFIGSSLGPDWVTVEAPLGAFPGLRWSSLENLSLSVEGRYGSSGAIFVDDIELRTSLTRLAVEDFERAVLPDAGVGRIVANGDVAITGEVVSVEGTRAYRIDYSGNIGRIITDPEPVFSYGGWARGLGGVNCSDCQWLSFRVRGAHGGETPNVYLDDGHFRWGVDLEPYATVTSSWVDVRIPLEDFARFGVDVTHLTEVQFIVEWDKASGSIFIDDIGFGSDSPAGGRPERPRVP
jgi:hypothetical protein